VLFVATGISVYAFETYLELQVRKQTRQRMTEEMGVPYDTRKRIEVLEDLRKDDVETYTNFGPRRFIYSNGFITNNERIYPLGGISNTTVVGSNESGYYPIIKTDEHGFNNPKGLYKKNRVDIVLTGDSFTDGFSVHSDETISAVLRELDFNVLNIGKSATGSLVELATIKEYAEPLKPKIVSWLYYVNDIGETVNEMNSPLLRKYLNENGFSQNLIARQDEIDRLLMNYFREELDEKLLKVERENLKVEREKEKQREKIIHYWTIRVFKLTNLRTRLNLTPGPEPEPEQPEPEPEPEPEQLEIFKDILDKSKRMVSGWGGKMYFVYLPEFQQYSTGKEHINREFVLRTAIELDIPVVDIHTEVFAPHPDPLSLFPFRMRGHYNAEGYRLVAEAIAKRLKADGVIPSNSNN